MSLSSKFSHDLWKQLHNKVDSYHWYVEYRLDRHRGNRECVDVGGEPKPHNRRNLPLILIESELRREDPVSNVLKVWRRALKRKYASGLCLIQGFSQIYRSRKYHNRGIKAECAKQFGRMMEHSMKRKRAFRYIPISIRYYPRAGSNEGNGARHDAAVRFGNTIVGHLRRIGVPLR